MLQTYELKNGGVAVFDPETLKIWKISGEEDFDRGMDERACREKFGDPVNNPVLIPEAEAVSEKDFDTLVLHIANRCTMQCKYCYESRSEYISDPGIMTEETALRAIDLFYSRYTYIREIKFFGGEPALNRPVIRAVCQRVEELAGEGKMRKKPVFKIITNGTVMNREFIDLVNQYQIKVVFSIDGEAWAHDRLRVYSNLSATFEDVSRNFFLMRQETGDKQPYSINATYTGVHEAKGMGICDLLFTLSDRFHVSPKKININPVMTDEGESFALAGKEYELHAAQDALERARKGDCRAYTRLNAVIRRLNRGGVLTENPCPAAGTWAAVSYAGDVYPCMMFINRQDCHMGNIRDNIFETEECRRVQERFQKIHREDFAACRECPARKVCSACMGINEFETGEIYPRSAEGCREYRGIVETVIRGIAEGVW